MRALFLINPRAGRGSGLRLWRQLEREVPSGLRYDVVVPTSSTETRRIAAEAAQSGVDRVIVLGGDGTLSDVARELAYSNTVMGIVPAGTGNDCCRNLGIPFEPEAALELACRGEAHRIDLGRTSGGRYFLNAAGVGFDAEVAERSCRLKTGLRGTFPYLVGALSTLLWYKPVHVDVSVDDQLYSGPTMLVAIANGRCYGGGMQIAPFAQWDDGQLDACVVGSLSRLELLNLLRQVYSGRHVRHPKVHMMRGRQIRLRVRERIQAHLDGEPLHEDSLEFEVSPGALSVAMRLQPVHMGHAH